MAVARNAEETMKAMQVFAGLLAVFAALAVPTVPAAAQDAAANYPNRPVKLLIAFPVGGLLDTVSRVVGEKLSAVLGQQIIIEARPGAGGTLATAAVAKADPDGYTLMMINDNHSLNPSVFKNIPYDSVKDFAPVGFVGSAPLVFVVNSAQVPSKTVKDLVAQTQKENAPLTYGSVGIGSVSHIAGELFAAASGAKMQHIPYRGGAPALNDLVAGHLKSQFLSAVIGLQHIHSGVLRPLAVTAPTRLEVLPDSPTMAEAGYPIEAGYWFGMVAPAGTPAPILGKLENALAQVLAMPDVKKRLTEMGALVTPLGQKPFGEYIVSEIKKWGDVIATNKITVPQ
jgi:tripartite-type tricarboxylate transporter receptor subunit TctC